MSKANGKFQVGEYKTRDGRKAFVRFVLQEPNDAIYKLIGEVQNCDGTWLRQTWKTDGSNFDGIVSGLDLLEPKSYLYYTLDEYGLTNFVNGPELLRVELMKDGRCDWSTLTRLGSNYEQQITRTSQ